MRALERDPGERHASAEELGVEVGGGRGRSLGHPTGSTPRRSTSPRPGRSAPRPTAPTQPGTDSVLPATIAELPQAPPTDPPGGVRPQSSPPAPEGRPRRRLGLVAAVVAALALGRWARGAARGRRRRGPGPQAERADPGGATPADRASPDWEAAARHAERPPADAGHGAGRHRLDRRRPARRRPWTRGEQGGRGPRHDAQLLWQTGPPLPVPLHHAMAVSYKDELVVLGGWIPKGSNLTPATSKRVFALRGERWVELPPHEPPATRRRRPPSSTGPDRRRRRPVRRPPRRPTEVFDGKRWSDGAAMPTPREHSPRRRDGRYVYAVGGRRPRRTRTSPPSSATTRPRTAGRSCRTCRPPAAASAPRSPRPAVRGRRRDADERARAPSRRTTSARTAGRRARRCARPRHGMAVVAAGGRLYALGGALKPGHTNSTATGEALILRISRCRPPRSTPTAPRPPS